MTRLSSYYYKSIIHKLNKLEHAIRLSHFILAKKLLHSYADDVI